MRNVLGKAGLLGSVSVAFSSMIWSQQKTKSEPGSSNSPTSDTNPGSTYELKLVQVLFRHGARTPLKSIPDVMEVKLQVSVFSQFIQMCYCIWWCLCEIICFVSLKAQWVPTLLEPPPHTHINYTVTDLQGGPRPPAPVEDNYRRNILSVSRWALRC